MGYILFYPLILDGRRTCFILHIKTGLICYTWHTQFFMTYATYEIRGNNAKVALSKQVNSFACADQEFFGGGGWGWVGPRPIFVNFTMSI